ncbi:MAG: DUF1559 domain-containing protein [Pirellulales bacterium]
MRSIIQNHHKRSDFGLRSVLTTYAIGVLISLGFITKSQAQVTRTQIAQGQNGLVQFAQANTLAMMTAKTKGLDSLAGLTPDQKRLFSALSDFTSGNVVQVYFDLTASSVVDSRIHLSAPAADKQKELETKLRSFGVTSIDKQQGYWVLYQNAAKIRPLSPAPRTDLELALKSVDSSDIQMLIALPGHVQRSLIENYDAIDEAWGGGSAQQWSSAFRSVALGVWLKDSKAKLVFQVQDPSAAKSVTAKLPLILKQLASLVERRFGNSIAGFVRRASEAELRVGQTQVELEFSTDQSNSLPTALAEALSGEAAREVKIHRMREIGLAIHNYESANQCLPPSAKQRDELGKAKLSWRVLVLPFLDAECRQLYQEFNLDEPWDSPHNKALIPKMPKIYSTSNSTGISNLLGNQTGLTAFQAPVGKGTMFGGNEVVTFSRVLDGLSNTAMIIEVKSEKAVPWTAPDDYTFDPQQSMAGLATDSQGNFLMLMGDGSVTTLSNKIGNQMAINLFEINDGRVIELNPK